MEEHWADEIISCILCFLPAKTIIRFKSVCKQWNLLTQCQYFIKSHLQQASKTNNDFSLILVNRTICSKSLSFMHSADLDSLDDHLITETNSPMLTFKDRYRIVNVLGSCNGIALVLAQSEEKPYQLILWNVSTQEYQVLQMSQEKVLNIKKLQSGIQWVFYGFGYDSTNDDYKILIQFRRSDQMGHRDPIIQKHIYSLRSNSWRKIKNNPFPIHTQAQHGAPSYGGSIHWLAATDLLAFPTLIVALDLGTEEYCFVPLPENIDQKSSSHFGTLGLLGGSLCVTSIFRLLDKCRVDVWVMKNYMVKESWMNLFSFLQNGIDPIVRVKPLAFFKNDEEDGRVLLVEIMNDRVFWYNYKTGNKVDQIDGLRNFMAKHVCLRTLVSLSKYGMVDDGIRKRLIIQDKSKQKKRKTC